jgi:hypothetical protein
MLVDNDNFREAAHIGEEILSNRDLAIRTQCLAVEGTVSSGVLTLEKALRIYKVPFEIYVDFIANNHVNSITNQIKSDSEKDTIIFNIKVMEKILQLSFATFDSKLITSIIKSLTSLSKEVENDKVAIK